MVRVKESALQAVALYRPPGVVPLIKIVLVVPVILAAVAPRLSAAPSAAIVENVIADGLL